MRAAPTRSALWAGVLAQGALMASASGAWGTVPLEVAKAESGRVFDGSAPKVPIQTALSSQEGAGFPPSLQAARKAADSSGAPGLPEDYGSGDVLSRFEEIAVSNLRGNYGELEGAGRTWKIILAGQRNFQDLWTRDFCFAALGAMELGDFEVVRDSLELLFRMQREDGYYPRRVGKKRRLGVWSVLLGFNKRTKDGLYVDDFSSYHTTPVDGNALVTWIAAEYAIRSGDKAFLERHLPSIEKGFRWLEDRTREGLVVQEAYADWQDMVKRGGKVLYTNLVYLKAVRSMAQLYALRSEGAKANAAAKQASELAQKVDRFFWDERKGYYRNSDTLDNLAPDGNLLAVLFGVANSERARSILGKTEGSVFYDPVPARAAHPGYPFYMKPPELWVGGITGYHDRAHWPWLGGLLALAQESRGDHEQALKTLERLGSFVVRDGAVVEVYDSEGKPLRSWVYRAEAPFSWNAGLLLYALRKVRGED